nr:hypothetical protein [Tanacetum cinerariifolium]
MRKTRHTLFAVTWLWWYGGGAADGGGGCWWWHGVKSDDGGEMKTVQVVTVAVAWWRLQSSSAMASLCLSSEKLLCQWELITGSGMPYAFYSQQSSLKLDALSAFKFPE